MRIPCPQCPAEYEVPEAALASHRRLRCGACLHEWRTAEPPAPRSIFSAAAPATDAPVVDTPLWVPPIPATPSDDATAPIWSAPLPSAEPDVAANPPRHFGEPVDDAAEAEIHQAVAAEDSPHAAGQPLPMFLTAGHNIHGESAPDSSKPDGFAELVDAARRNKVQVEPEHRIKVRVKRASNKGLVFLLLVALIAALMVVERHNIIRLLPATARFYLALGLR